MRSPMAEFLASIDDLKKRHGTGVNFERMGYAPRNPFLLRTQRKRKV